MITFHTVRNTRQSAPPLILTCPFFHLSLAVGAEVVASRTEPRRGSTRPRSPFPPPGGAGLGAPPPLPAARPSPAASPPATHQCRLTPSPAPPPVPSQPRGSSRTETGGRPLRRRGLDEAKGLGRARRRRRGRAKRQPGRQRAEAGRRRAVRGWERRRGTPSARDSVIPVPKGTKEDCIWKVNSLREMSPSHPMSPPKWSRPVRSQTNTTLVSDLSPCTNDRKVTSSSPSCMLTILYQWLLDHSTHCIIVSPSAILRPKRCL
ncbi:hypothetical protein BS78_10G047000 [Paspalum vaginatum]|nr:hypothetical protein BS78_10G047000 [Paspalum vaginatum]